MPINENLNEVKANEDKLLRPLIIINRLSIFCTGLFFVLATLNMWPLDQDFFMTSIVFILFVSFLMLFVSFMDFQKNRWDYLKNRSKAFFI